VDGIHILPDVGYRILDYLFLALYLRFDGLQLRYELYGFAALVCEERLLLEHPFDLERVEMQFLIELFRPLL
jgi:hypothetical protein